MKRLKIEIYVNHFVVHVRDKNLWNVLYGFTKELVSYKFEFNKRIRRLIRVIDKTYCVIHEREGIIRFPLSMLKLILSTLGYHWGVKFDQIEFIDYSKIETGLPAKFKFNSKKYELRDYQLEYANILTANKTDIRMVDLQTGRGKSVIASYALSKIGKKVGVVILPKYIEKWLEDFGNYLPESVSRTYVAQGSEGLVALMNNLEEAKEKYDIFIFPMRTLYNYIGEYADNDVPASKIDKYPISPDNLCQALGIGVILSDECHQEFYSLFRALMYFKVDKIIALSATFESNDKHMQYIYNTLIPPGVKVSNLIAYDKYIDVIGVKYYVQDAYRIPCSRQQGYSHIMFEQYLLNNTYFLKQYITMLLHYVEEGYMSRRKKGEKLLVFCSTVDMCKHVCRMVSLKYGKLDVRTYTQEDEYDNIIEADIIISTVISSGTALNFPNLITTIMTISIGSLQANVQALGRLRKLKDRDVRYYYLYCANLKKQIDLNTKREEAIKNKVRSYTYVKYRPENRNELLLK